MKNLIYLKFLIIMIILNGCSSDDNNSNNSKIQINPPSWIQGKWLIEGVSNNAGWRFTLNDVISIQNGIEISERGQLEMVLQSSQNVSTSEEISSNRYKLISNYPAGQTTIKTFTKISNTEISWDDTPGIVFVKQ